MLAKANTAGAQWRSETLKYLGMKRGSNRETWSHAFRMHQGACQRWRTPGHRALVRWMLQLARAAPESRVFEPAGDPNAGSREGLTS